ncbi:hypothetical protein BJ170DRAFT_625162 [Xylariales sp. AK1849]|nr:hypothetical protein BJ170DRAFT_625162 [Xylariales sp. AK1849]
MPIKWYHEPALHEHLSSDTFWVLAIIIGINAYWTNRQVELFDKFGNEIKATEAPDNAVDGYSCGSEPRTAPPKQYRWWLQPYITSRPRRILAIIICGLVLPIQLLEGYWVLQTAWRLTAATLKATYPHMKPYILGFVLYLPVLAILLAAWVAVLAMGVFMVSLQLLYVLKLRELRPGVHVRRSPIEEDKIKDDAEWDDMGDAARVQGGVENAEEESLLPEKL